MRVQRPFVAALIVAATVACASDDGAMRQRTLQGEMGYVHAFCRAHSMVGISEAVDRELRVRWNRYESFSVGTTGQRSLRLQQRLIEYSSRWQHLHQRMTTACRDLAICRFRNQTAASSECNALRDRLDHSINDGQGFLLMLGEVDLRRAEEGVICPDCHAPY